MNSASLLLSARLIEAGVRFVTDLLEDWDTHQNNFDELAGREDGHTPDDVAASFFKNIGIDPKTEYDADVGRPITLIRDGSPISELF